MFAEVFFIWIKGRFQCYISKNLSEKFLGEYIRNCIDKMLKY